jgi:long-chain-fatty-acid--CoA ligase ACSBG
MILSKIKEAIGLDKTLVYLFGAAPLKKTTIEYFASLDIPLFNMYGLSETTGSTTSSYLDEFSLTHAGITLSGVEIKIEKPDEKGEGEIRVKGRHVMLGYLKNE